jgi:hypothetical protein
MMWISTMPGIPDTTRNITRAITGNNLKNRQKVKGERRKVFKKNRN